MTTRDLRGPSTCRRGLAWLVVLLLVAACGAEEAEPEREPPAYAAPSYATVESESVATDIRFHDVSRAAGIDFVHETGAFGQKWMPETMGSGGGFLDYDGDGWPDIFLVNGSEWPGHERRARATSRLYRNLGDGTFADVTESVGLDVTLYGMGASFADYDGDGDQDIYVTAVGTNALFRNDGGRFVDLTAQLGVSGNDPRPGAPPAWSTASAWIDVDRDGWLDLFVCNYVRWTPATDLFTTLDGKNKSYATPQQYQGESCRLYRNVAGRRFSDVTESAGVLNEDGKSLGVAVADVNDDGWTDLIVANDTEPNFLYLNDGDGTFTDVAVRAGIGYDEFGRARAGMGVDVADVRSDGTLSIAIGNFSREPLSLYTQIAPGLFQDLAGSAQLTRSSLLLLTFGVLFVDLDLDGFVDLVTGNGHIEPEINTVQRDITFAQPPHLFRNRGDGTFVDVTQVVGPDFAAPIVARGIAGADYDRDGDLDLLITVNGGRPKLLRNELPGDRRAHSLAIGLVGKAPNTQALGAVVTVYAGDLVVRRMVRTGSSYLAQSEVGYLLFGLGEADAADSLSVRWPVGQTTRIGRTGAGDRLVIREATGRPEPMRR